MEAQSAPLSDGGDSSAKAVIISSDGHAIANMEDYTDYLPSRMHEEFASFRETYHQFGARSSDPAALLLRVDPETAEQWSSEVVDTQRLEGISDAPARLADMDRDGRVADVLFADFGIPFEMGSAFRRAVFGSAPTQEQVVEGQKAHNRWLHDFCSAAPHRLIGQALIDFADIDAAVSEIRWAHAAGFKAVILPSFDFDLPLFDRRFDPIWHVLEELDMPINGHAGLSMVAQPQMAMDSIPHPACVFPLYNDMSKFYAHMILHHFIWGGVFERHPRLRVIFTEQGSGWVAGDIEAMDYTFEGSYLRRDIREVIKRRPSEYFARQCWLGSSIFSRAEMEWRYRIGVDKIMLGMDYPHQEGTWAMGPGSVEYLRATVGAAGVPVAEAQLMLGQTAASVFDLDLVALEKEAARIGPDLSEVLSPPVADLFPRGDVKKPIGASF